MNSQLARQTFKVSRLAEFATESELTRLVGGPKENWLVIILKELADNALDASEEARCPPVIAITRDDSALIVEDKGPGIAPEAVASIFNYEVRTSSRAAYVSPTRGQQGNALQTVLAMSYVAARSTTGRVVIESQSVRSDISFKVDPVRQKPVVAIRRGSSLVRIGARVTVALPNLASSISGDAYPEFLQLVRSFACLNPHLDISFNGRRFLPTAPDWRRWRPSDPTSAYWYNEQQLKALIAAKVAFAEDHRVPCQTVREFVREFDGLSSTAKTARISAELDASRMTLRDFLSSGRVRALLTAMRNKSRVVKPVALGLIGEAHLKTRFQNEGGVLETFAYRRFLGTYNDDLPLVLEVAFGYGPKWKEALIVEGVNFSPAACAGQSPFNVASLLEQLRIGPNYPLAMFLSMTTPSATYIDRSKAHIAAPPAVFQKMSELLTTVSKRWTKQIKAEERDYRRLGRRLEAIGRQRSKHVSQKKAAFAVMAAAYAKAADDGQGGFLPVNPRQIYYAARPQILAMTGKGSLDSNYFLQTLLNAYLKAHDVDWDVVWDDRGHHVEPHTDRAIGLGTLAVRNYTGGFGAPKIEPASIAPAVVTTSGPRGRFQAAVFIEKEGFMSHLEAAGIAEKYDVAILSSKGMSVTAARQLVDRLAGEGVRLFVLHDLDISGFSILKTLTASGDRYAFKNKLNFVDLGLRLADVERLDLQSESVVIEHDHAAVAARLKFNGATRHEIKFLLSGRRVELNAMTSRGFIDFVEDGLRRHGVRKLTPDKTLMRDAYVEMRRGRRAEAALAAEMARLAEVKIAVPADLMTRLHKVLADHPLQSWDQALASLVEEDSERKDDDDGRSAALPPADRF
jgi:DNA topoisomerase VI subunit B